MILRRSASGRPVGDVVPFFDHKNRRYHLFHLTVSEHGTDEDRLAHVTWEHASSPDLVRWDWHPTALVPGEKGSVDADGVYTGCIIERQGVYHLYYAGILADARTPQTICHATSTDLERFEKDPANPLILPVGDPFELGDWRDPFVFWNEDAGEYWMLISARLDTGPSARRGALAVARSADLASWDVDPVPLLVPWNTHVPECSELHHLEGVHLLSYSSYSDHAGLHHHRSGSVTGPWEPALGFTDGARWYAGKSMVDSQGRLITFAWIPERAQRDNARELVWGGDFGVPRETWVDAHGRVGQRVVPETLHEFSFPQEWSVHPELGVWNVAHGAATASASHLAVARIDVSLEDEPVVLDGQLRWTGPGRLGLVFNADQNLTAGIQLTIDPSASIVRLEEITADFQHTVVSARGPWVEHHYDPVQPGEAELVVVLGESTIEVFLDDRLALSHRYYPQQRSVRLFAENVDSSFNLSLRSTTPSKQPGT